MLFRQKIIGDYVFTRCRNAFSIGTSIWLSKKDVPTAMYCFSFEGAGNYKEEMNDADNWIRLFQKRIENGG